MNSHRKTSIIVGVLFLIATVASVGSYFFFNSIYKPDYLTAVSENQTNIIIGTLIMLTAAASIVGIPIAIYPILKKQNESLALSYVGARFFEGLFFVINIITLLSILSLSHEFVNAISPNLPYFETSGALLLEEFEWNSILLDFAFALSAVIFNYMLYRSKLIPRWLSIWGFIGGILWTGGACLGLFRFMDISLLAAPIGIQEMLLVVWLIFKGFNLSIKNSSSTK